MNSKITGEIGAITRAMDLLEKDFKRHSKTIRSMISKLRSDFKEEKEKAKK